MVLYCMRCNFLYAEFLKNIELIIESFYGLVDVRELLLKLNFPVTVPQEELISRSSLPKLADGFPTLVDMKLSFYKFVVTDSKRNITKCKKLPTGV